jgi:Rhodopirellula transposase DDE domain
MNTSYGGTYVERVYGSEIENLMKKYFDSLDERARRRYAAIEVLKLGYGGQKYIAQVLGCCEKTIITAKNELKDEHNYFDDPERIRRPGGGIKKIIDSTPGIDERFLEMMNTYTAGDPQQEGVIWTHLTLVDMSDKLREQGMNISSKTVKQLLARHNFRRRKMAKVSQHKKHPDQDKQFKRIAELREAYSVSQEPVISIDVKKKS